MIRQPWRDEDGGRDHGGDFRHEYQRLFLNLRDRLKDGDDQPDHQPNDEQWRRFCIIADLPADERFTTNRQRVSGYDALRPFVADRLREMPRQFWIDGLTKAGVPYNNEYCFVYRLEDGAIKEVTEYMDTELVTSALASLP